MRRFALVACGALMLLPGLYLFPLWLASVPLLSGAAAALIAAAMLRPTRVVA